jgi:hypothetical protein
MAPERNWFKEILDWLHHVYWIREFLISSGIAVAAMKWLVSHVGLLSQYGWAIWLLLAGLLMYLFDWRRRRLNPGETEKYLRIPESKVEQILRPLFRDAKGAGAQAGILWTLAAQARDVLVNLEQVWHHWNDAGERLIHPLDARIDKPDFLKGNLIAERRDFMAIYMTHLMRLRVDVPGFTSNVTVYGFPSDREYLQVRNALQDHADKLDAAADAIWKSEEPNGTFFERRA